ncbi:hypothetical protein DPMN_139557 [Dreissena polymorpha]|uniref:Uncharacterized protein n=1 Tax=Dreissena polymorpha TaxID=45954 RepID=A0A9D4G984_DREPO|nr:hypothetical protein DPMN_139557 [Dreissena polymorpha]
MLSSQRSGWYMHLSLLQPGFNPHSRGIRLPHQPPITVDLSGPFTIDAAICSKATLLVSLTDNSFIHLCGKEQACGYLFAKKHSSGFSRIRTRDLPIPRTAYYKQTFVPT